MIYPRIKSAFKKTRWITEKREKEMDVTRIMHLFQSFTRPVTCAAPWTN